MFKHVFHFEYYSHPSIFIQRSEHTITPITGSQHNFFQTLIELRGLI